MENVSPKLIINKLELVGREKSYIVNFNKGLNIIYGDSDTGKSSILNLIDYLLGSSKVDMYDEIEQYGKFALLEVEINNKTFTIKRDIFDSKKYIEVYTGTIDNMNNVFPLEYGPNYNIDGPAGYYSDFLLSNLNIPIIKVKEAPSKADSKMVRLSFRDIFKYCYFNQDEVGSKEILDRKSFAQVIKNKETFKFIHNVLDTQISELQNEIGLKNREKSILENNYKVISSFFLETQISTEESLRERKEDLKDQISLVEDEINKLNQVMRSDNNEIELLRQEVIHLEEELNEKIRNKSYKETQLENYFRLRKDYESDISKLKISLKVKGKLTPYNVEKISCPVCSNSLKFENITEFFSDNKEEVLNKELNSIRNRLKDLKVIIEDTRDNIFTIEEDISGKRNLLERARLALDNSSENFISPYISQRDILITERSSLVEKVEKLDYLIKIRNQLKEINNKIELLGGQIEELDKKLAILNSSAPSIDSVLINIGTYLKEFLEFIPIKNAFGISISDKTYLPRVRNRDYTDLTSGGLRTLVSVGYILSLLKDSLYTDTNYPSLVIIDTIGKYLGKTKKEYTKDTDLKEDKNEGLNDPTKYLKIYKFLDEMSSSLLVNKKDHQIIIVDNDFPEELETNYSKYVVKKFSVENREGFEIGFINNAKNLMSK
jgi:predicted  nucleic acid-binding Zn-ribbon protein